MAISHKNGVSVAGISHFNGVAKANVSAINGVTASFGGGGGITFVAAGTFQGSVDAITPGLPAGTAENDILIAFLHTAGQAITISGWTEASNSPQTTSGYVHRLTVFWKRAGASESAPTTDDSGNHNTGVILGFRGCVASGNPFDATSGSEDTNLESSVTIPGVTTTVANAMVVAAAGIKYQSNSSNVITSGANAGLTSFTERVDQFSSAGSGGGFAIFTGVKASAGATGNTTCTYPPGDIGAPSDKACWTGALIPA